MDEYAERLDRLEEEINRFRELEELFELQERNYPEISETHFHLP